MLFHIFRRCSREYLMEKWQLDFSLSEHVSVLLNGEEYESNRYDVFFYDPRAGKTISMRLYMDEDSSFIYAVDEVVADEEEEDVFYPLHETPFLKIIEDVIRTFPE